jgi:hypothetical protein
MNDWLCRFGIHKKMHIDTWVPSRDAEIVTEYTHTVLCAKCKKILNEEKWTYERQE